MDEHFYISRRRFLASGVAVGTACLAPLDSWGALPSSPHVAALEGIVTGGAIGSLEYIQFHCTDDFDFETAVITVEHLARKLTLEKVSALGDFEISEEPENILASLYFEEGLRGTISTAVSTQKSFGRVLGDDGSVEILKDRIDMLGRDGVVLDSVRARPVTLRGSSVAYPMVLRALRDGVTVFA